MKLIVAILIAIFIPWIVMRIIIFARRIEHEAELFQMGCHPRQRQLERKIIDRI